jgi:cell wall-associated NlpC family hydrolase
VKPILGSAGQPFQPEPDSSLRRRARKGFLVPAVVRPARLSRVLLVAPATLAVGALGVAVPPLATASGARATSVTSTSTVADYGFQAKVVIRVSDSSGTLGSVPVRIYRHRSTGDTYVTTVTTWPVKHVAHFYPRLKSSATYRFVFPGNAGHAASSTLQRVTVRGFGASLLDVGSSKKGAPYRYGGTGPYAFDCSGFTRWVAGRFGKSLAHSSSSQYSEVRHIARADKRIGDLVFVHDSSGHVYHVGFYAGDGKLLAATHTGDYVRIETLWTSSYYVGRLTP